MTPSRVEHERGQQYRANLCAATCLALLAFASLCAIIAVVGTIDTSSHKPADCIATNTCFCERLRPEGQIKQPVSTWTNLAFIIYGLVQAVMITHKAPVGYKAMAVYSCALVIHGLFSALYHETMIFSTQVLDNIGMYLSVGWLPSYCLERSLRVTLPTSIKRRETIISACFAFAYGTIVLCGTAVNIWASAFGYMTFALTLALAIVIAPLSDWRSLFLHHALRHICTDYIKPNIQIRRKTWMFWAALAMFAVAFAFWVADFKRVLCAPDGAYQGHGVWHVLASSALFSMFLYYYTERFEVGEDMPSDETVHLRNADNSDAVVEINT